MTKEQVLQDIVDIHQDGGISKRVFENSINMVNDTIPEDAIPLVGEGDVYATDYGTLVIGFFSDEQYTEIDLEIGSEEFGYCIEFRGVIGCMVESALFIDKDLECLKLQINNFLSDIN